MTVSPRPRSVIPVGLVLCLTLSPGAEAGDGAADYREDGGAGYGEAPSGERPRRDDCRRHERPNPDGDAERPRREDQQTPDARRRQEGGRPVLSSFSISSDRLYLYGRAARVRFRIDDESELVNVALYLTRPGGSAAVRALDLRARPTGVDQTYRLTGREGAPLPEGPYRARIVARDAAGNSLTIRPRASAVAQISFYRHRFPLRGSFSYGGDDARFGAKRSGHRHQGQDLTAPVGTPVVAPRGGRVTKVDYQAGGAGHYVVLDGAGENDSYVFMHLEEGSVRVRTGQWVRTGAPLGNVGNSGASSGAHLHFEIWRGSWYGGGEPFDPYPSLRRWDRWS